MIALTLSALGDVAGVIDYLARNPESALVRIDRVHFAPNSRRWIGVKPS